MTARRKLQTPAIDLSEILAFHDFDVVMKALHDIVARSESLALDELADRAVLVARLAAALGAVVERRTCAWGRWCPLLPFNLPSPPREHNIGRFAATWVGQCYAIATLLPSGTGPGGVAVYGHWLGAPVHVVTSQSAGTCRLSTTVGCTYRHSGAS
jgi:hypothetical protein